MGYELQIVWGDSVVGYTKALSWAEIEAVVKNLKLTTGVRFVITPQDTVDEKGRPHG